MARGVENGGRVGDLQTAYAVEGVEVRFEFRVTVFKIFQCAL